MTSTQPAECGKSFLPLELATKYYEKWDCDVQIYTTDASYYKCLSGFGEV
jgi:hypothetical protein